MEQNFFDEFDDILNGFDFSSDLQVEDDRANVGDDSLELRHLFPDDGNSHQTIPEGEQPTENPNTDQNAYISDDPAPRMANGSQDGLMYQMYPSWFLSIVGLLSVKQQPKANKRLRYQSGGSRILPDSRYHPMAINLPNLESIGLQGHLQLGVVITIVTTTCDQTFVHANDIVYDVSNARKIGHGCVFVPLDLNDIQMGEKAFRRLSIINKKCDEYTFDLTPFHPYSMFGATEKYMGEDQNIGKAAKAKKFKNEYNLLSYKIVFQLALKENDVVYISHMICETEPIHDQRTATPTGKRSAPVAAENLTETGGITDALVPSPSKRLKSCPSPTAGLPVTYAPNVGDTNHTIC